MARRTLLGQNKLEVRLFHLLPLERKLILVSTNRYILRVFAWCRKYGIRVNLDLHTIPGSQNGARFTVTVPHYLISCAFVTGYNHSGKGGQVNFLEGVMGFANAQRALEYIRVFTEFISQPQYSNVVQMFGIVNEPLASQDVLTSL